MEGRLGDHGRNPNATCPNANAISDTHSASSSYADADADANANSFANTNATTCPYANSASGPVPASPASPAWPSWNLLLVSMG